EIAAITVLLDQHQAAVGIHSEPFGGDIVKAILAVGVGDIYASPTGLGVEARRAVGGDRIAAVLHASPVLGTRVGEDITPLLAVGTGREERHHYRFRSGAQHRIRQQPGAGYRPGALLDPAEVELGLAGVSLLEGKQRAVEALHVIHARADSAVAGGVDEVRSPGNVQRTGFGVIDVGACDDTVAHRVGTG